MKKVKYYVSIQNSKVKTAKEWEREDGIKPYNHQGAYLSVGFRPANWVLTADKKSDSWGRDDGIAIYKWDSELKDFETLTYLYIYKYLYPSLPSGRVG